MLLNRHPSFASLNRFADDELGPRRRRRVANHLADCDQCRKDVSFIRQAGQLARTLETPAVPEGLLERILERRANGERVILPLESPGARAPRGRRALPAIAAVLTLFAVGLFVSTDLLQADRPGLRIEPQRPRAGDTLAIEYDGGYEFSDLDHLVLRARYLTRSVRSWQQTADMLQRGDDGAFHARVPLPDSVVYVAFAVESPRGNRVDHNEGRLWDIMVHGPDGRPTLDALTQRYLDVLVRDPPEARRTVDALVELYPESPLGWYLKATSASRGSGNDSVTAFYRRTLRRIEREFMETAPADPDDFAVLGLFAATMGELADLQHWTAEAERRGARSRWLTQAKTAVVVAYRQLPPAAALEELESIWQDAPTPLLNVAWQGWSHALEARDWDAALRWLPRYRQTAGFAGTARLLGALRDAFGPQAALDWALAKAEDELLRTEAHRRLNRTPLEQQRLLEADRQEILATMASMALATGQGELAVRLAVEGLTLAWETAALTTIGEILLAAGDTANAAAAFARVAADPASPPVPEAVTGRADWTERLETARYALTRYVLGESVVRYLPVGVAPDSGPTVVAFLSTCGRYAKAVRDLAPERVTIYATSDIDAVRAELAACGLETPVRPDPTGRIAEEYGLRAFEALFVTDGVGRVRFSHAEAEHLPRDLMALRGADSALAD